MYWGGWSPELLTSELPSAWPADVVKELRAIELSRRFLWLFLASKWPNRRNRDERFHIRRSASRFARAAPRWTVDGYRRNASRDTSRSSRGAFQQIHAHCGGVAGDVGRASDGDSATVTTTQGRAEAGSAARGSGTIRPCGLLSVQQIQRGSTAHESGTRSRFRMQDGRREKTIDGRRALPSERAQDRSGRWEAPRHGSGDGARSPCVPPNGVVIIALGTIESTRLAQHFVSITSASSVRSYRKKSNGPSSVQRRFSSSAGGVEVPAGDRKGAAGFSPIRKGSAPFADGSGVGHYHLQITATGGAAGLANSEAELFKKVPDIDKFEQHLHASDTHVVITVRGIGEMQPLNAQSFVRPDPETEFGVKRAFVSIQPSTRDMELWEAMDQGGRRCCTSFCEWKQDRP